MESILMTIEDDQRVYCGFQDDMENLKDLTKFDADAFGINPKHAEEMDPQLRIFLKTTYEVTADADKKIQFINGDI
ncbi:hypothetical protein CHUAL_007874 [Chamberlinius hualienensis]